MTAPIVPPSQVMPMPPPRLDRPTDTTQAVPFAERLEQIVEEANRTQVEATERSTEFAEGRSNDVHGTMISLSQADIQLRFVASVRNKILEAYREVMRMGA